MFHAILRKITAPRSSDEDRSSEFSRFFRTARSEEKKKVFMDVARKASKDQSRVFQSNRLSKTV